MSGVFRFDRFVLDPVDRRLLRDGAVVDLSPRYFDALVLMVGEPGRLITKDRFLDEVWQGVPVTDEALTQCIRSLRRALDDDAARPRFIQTAPKHGYRFIGAIEAPVHAQASRTSVPAEFSGRWDQVLRTARSGMLGGGAAGFVGGLLYGLVGVSSNAGGGAISSLVVIACLTMLVGLGGGAGIGFGIGAAYLAPKQRKAWGVLGGAAGGMTVGAMVKLIGLDAFDLLFGQAPSDMTGAPEGAMLGAAVGLGVLALKLFPDRRGLTAAGAICVVVGALVPWLGGHLMGGSLNLLTEGFPLSRLALTSLGRVFGESSFGPVSQSVSAGLEVGLFGLSVVWAIDRYGLRYAQPRIQGDVDQ
ncbi:MAG: transcriptional regulator [Zymomonas sp.]|nr:MAG: transcriptional regulator [Zymomonas sp.]